MKHKIICLLTLLFCIFTISSCDTTYSDIEYKNLSNEKNYQKFDVKFSYVKVLNSTAQTSEFQNERLEFAVTFLTLEELNLFKTTKLESVSSLDSYPIIFTVLKENTNSLLENNFFNEINEGDTITIWVSMYHGINTIYNFLAGVSSADKTYLTFDEGLARIIQHMDDNRSPWFN